MDGDPVAGDWGEGRAPALGLALPRYRPWSFDITKYGGVTFLTHRPPGGEGTVWVRVGAGQTVAAFLAALAPGDALTTVRQEADGPAELAGQPARRVELRATVSAHDVVVVDDGRPATIDQPGRRDRIVGLGPTAGPLAGRLLAGYRLPAERLAAWGPIAERILAGLRRLAAG